MGESGGVVQVGLEVKESFGGEHRGPLIDSEGTTMSKKQSTQRQELYVDTDLGKKTKQKLTDTASKEQP